MNRILNALDKTIHASALPVRSGNNLLDAILGELVQKYSDVKLILNGAYPDHSVLSDVDFCTIFFNALSNAFEAAEQTEEKKVEKKKKPSGGGKLPPINSNVVFFAILVIGIIIFTVI